MSANKTRSTRRDPPHRLICAKCKDPADPMIRVQRKGILKVVPTAKRFMCTRCGRERSRIFGINF